MPTTDEPRGLVWINNLNMATFGPLVSQVLWAIGSVAFTWRACTMMGRQDGPETFNGLPVSHEAMRQLGFLLAGALLTAWTGKTIAGVVDSQQKRTADPKYKDVLEAKERGKVAGAAAAVAIKESAKDLQAARLNLTGERPAVTVNAKDQSQVKVAPLRPSTTQPIIDEEPIPAEEMAT